jgi:hypothetical protein
MTDAAVTVDDATLNVADSAYNAAQWKGLCKTECLRAAIAALPRAVDDAMCEAVKTYLGSLQIDPNTRMEATFGGYHFTTGIAVDRLRAALQAALSSPPTPPVALTDMELREMWDRHRSVSGILLHALGSVNLITMKVEKWFTKFSKPHSPPPPHHPPTHGMRGWRSSTSGRLTVKQYLATSSGGLIERKP